MRVSRSLLFLRRIPSSINDYPADSLYKRIVNPGSGERVRQPQAKHLRELDRRRRRGRQFGQSPNAHQGSALIVPHAGSQPLFRWGFGVLQLADCGDFHRSRQSVLIQPNESAPSSVGTSILSSLGILARWISMRYRGPSISSPWHFGHFVGGRTLFLSLRSL